MADLISVWTGRLLHFGIRATRHGTFAVLALLVVSAGGIWTSSAHAITVNVGPDCDEFGVGFGKMADGQTTLIVSLVPKTSCTITSSSKVDQAGTAIWNRTITSGTHKWEAAGVRSNDGHAVRFHGTFSCEGPGTGPPSMFDVGVVDLDIDVDGSNTVQADDEEDDAAGGSYLCNGMISGSTYPSSLSLAGVPYRTLKVVCRPKWHESSPDVGTLTFAVTGAHLYDLNGDTVTSLTIPSAGKTVDCAIVTNDASTNGSITAAFAWTVPGGGSGAIDIVKLNVVDISAITVESGATQTNVTGATNWAEVKKTGEYVIIKATTVPDVAGAWEKITWTGGEAVPGGTKNKRRVSRATSAKTNVKASCGVSSKDLNVWILWGAVTIKMTGTTPTNSKQFGTILDGTENLGAISYSGGTKASGKIAAIGALTPAGVKDVVKAGWAFKRDRKWRVCQDGAKVLTLWETEWTDDTSIPDYLELTPQVNDEIYDIDGPNVAPTGATDCTEVWLNFHQWIEWNGKAASDLYKDWSWHGKWVNGAEPEEITVKVVSGTHLTLPTSCAACP